MSGNALDQRQASPQRPRHQITRSITEVSSPIRLHRHHHGQHPRARDRYRDERPAVAQSAAASLHGRTSLDGTRSETYTPNLSPDQSRRTSVHMQNDDIGAQPAAAAAAAAAAAPSQPASELTKEEQLGVELNKAAARTAYGPNHHWEICARPAAPG